jgi:hypothetical protein
VRDRKFPWNTREERCEIAPLIPAVHGTDFLIAEKIAQTGFISLSSLVCNMLLECAFLIHRMLGILPKGFILYDESFFFYAFAY